jgi:thiamine biosynthesis lipoprotein
MCFGIQSGVEGPKLTRFTYYEPHMGTRFKIIVYAPDEPKAREATTAAFARIAALDNTMSDYRPSSELMQLCKRAGGPSVPVSKDLFTVLRRAQEVARLSDGAFDVTVGPAARLWRRARKLHELPSSDELTQALALVGYQKMILNEKSHSVRLLKKGMLLDLGGIAKGYSADEALEVLGQHGIERALVAAGGDIVVGDSPPAAEGWTIGIAPLKETDSKPQRYLLLRHRAVSTSGDAQQHLEIGGTRYSHIIDPHTGIGLLGRQSVTVVARRGIDSDSLTKVVSVLGPQRGLPLLETVPGVAALVVSESPEGQVSCESKGFASLPHK